jgi:cytidylate kinase
MIVTIDGPAGAGKSSAARSLAKRLGFRFLDTGAMYRAVTYAALARGVDLEDFEALERVAYEIDLVVTDDRVLLDGQDVTSAIRTMEITALTRYAADHVGVRAKLVELQRSFAQGQNMVAEGRDQASVVFPHAECKVFLTASERERARRRHQDLLQRGEQATFEDVLEKQLTRDERDQTRAVGALRKSPDSVVLNTDGMSPEQVVDRLERIVRERAEKVSW